MASAREMRLRIRSVGNIAQVTRALQAVSASRVRRAAPDTPTLVRYCLERFRQPAAPVYYVFVGRKGRDMLTRRRVDVRADFSGLPAEPGFSDVSDIGRLVVRDVRGGG